MALRPSPYANKRRPVRDLAARRVSLIGTDTAAVHRARRARAVEGEGACARGRHRRAATDAPAQRGRGGRRLLRRESMLVFERGGRRRSCRSSAPPSCGVSEKERVLSNTFGASSGCAPTQRSASGTANSSRGSSAATGTSGPPRDPATREPRRGLVGTASTDELAAALRRR